MLAVLMTTPRWPSASGSVAAMASAATARTVNDPTRLISTTLRNSPRSCTPLRPTMRAEGPMPAQFDDRAQRPRGVVGRLRDGGADLLLGR